MKEHGLLLKPEMVRATLAGNKTQTRRVCTAQNSLIDGHPTGKAAWATLNWRDAWVDYGPSPAGNPGPYWHVQNIDGLRGHRVYPRVQPGDVLWVRETFALLSHDGTDELDPAKTDDGALWYRADPDCQSAWECSREDDRFKWRPSIFLPRWASRLILNVPSVRAEWVQDITEEDARAEGMDCYRQHSAYSDTQYISFYSAEHKKYVTVDDCRMGFMYLWDEINAPRGLAWDTNPPVWVYDFKRQAKDEVQP